MLHEEWVLSVKIKMHKKCNVVHLKLREKVILRIKFGTKRVELNCLNEKNSIKNIFILCGTCCC
jgi:hypothetical protein